MNRSLRITVTLVVSALAVAYIVAKIDLRKTIDILGSASVPWVVALGRPDARHGAADGVALAAPAATSAASTSPSPG